MSDNAALHSEASVHSDGSNIGNGICGACHFAWPCLVARLDEALRKAER